MLNKPITFAEIFSLQLEGYEEINSIEIPRIQRDYAQGRSTPEVERIRKQFLSALYNAVTANSEPIKLDFVYGNVTDGKLVPLDGQQRLTTLFLLHWYISKKEEVPIEKCNFLNRFTYNTRFSSSDFCEKIINYSPDLSGETVSEWLVDQHWYYYSWQYDPTISAMLKMIDSIHSVFGNTDDLWERLTNLDNPPISFYFLPLEDMGLTDTLYIKMNSRGKPLTDFEHFKAEFEGMMKKVSHKHHEYFIHKADKDWVDMLWQFRGNDNTIDDEFMRYFRFVSEMLCYRSDIAVQDDDFDLANVLYGSDCVNAEKHLSFLFNAIDCWCNLSIKNFFSSTFSNREYSAQSVTLYSENTNIFLECCKKYGIRSGRTRVFTLNNTLLLYGVLTYKLNSTKVTEKEFTERIRILRNLVMNSSDEIRIERMAQLLKLTESIIIDGSLTKETTDFNQIQKQQEIEKISWRNNYPELINDMNKLEDHRLLQGSVSIIGLEEPDKFSSRVESFYQVFGDKPDYITISRSLLAIQDYAQQHSFRFLLGSKLESTWRELFTESQHRKYFDRTQEAVVTLMDKVTKADSGDFIDQYLQDESTPKDWRYYFIKYPNMRAGQYGRYYWYTDNQYEVMMMRTESSLNGYHWNPFLYEAMKDSVVKAHCSLENYGDPLVINPQNICVKSTNDSFVFFDKNNNHEVIKEITIPQDEDGIDMIDRVELLIESIRGEVV